MPQDPIASLRAALTFEQQARFDALYAQRAKKVGMATVLSLPLLGTFGLDQFYLGNRGHGVLRLVFFWTLIPTFQALFEIISGDIKLQVTHANQRIAATIQRQVIAATPKPSDIPPAAAGVITPADVAGAAAIASVTPMTSAMATEPVATVESTTLVAEASTPTAATSPAAPVDVVASEVATREQTLTTTASTTVETSTAEWHAGMDAPLTTSDAATTTATASETLLTSAMAGEAVVSADAPPLSAAQRESDAETLSGDPLPTEGLLVFVDELPTGASGDVSSPAAQAPAGEVVAATTTQVTTEPVASTHVVESEHIVTQHYHDGKLVDASRADTQITHDVNTLLTDTTTDSLIAETEAHAGWVDTSPLQSEPAGGSVAPPSASTPPAAGTTDLPADTTSGGTTGGGLGTPPNGGTGTTGGGLGNPPDTGTPPDGVRPPGPIPE